MARHRKHPQLDSLAAQAANFPPAALAAAAADWVAQAKAVLCVPANFCDTVFLEELAASGLLAALHPVSNARPPRCCGLLRFRGIL